MNPRLFMAMKHLMWPHVAMFTLLPCLALPCLVLPCLAPVTHRPALAPALGLLVWSREVTTVVTALHRQRIQRLLSACHPLLHDHPVTPPVLFRERRGTAPDPLHVPRCAVHAGSARWSWTSCWRMGVSAGLDTRVERAAGPRD